MKLTKRALLKKTPNLYSTQDGVYSCFQEYDWEGVDKEHKLPDNLILLFADYTYEDYSGEAYVLGYNKDRKLFFEVHGSHCSCYGLEGQWDEEYYNDIGQLQAAIQRRLDNRSEYYRYAYSSHEFEKWLEEE